jgi:hypothetical protein
MSNPLIRPNDPRFQRQPLTDEAGQNRFSDDAPVPAMPADQPRADASVYASPQVSEEPAYRPEYVSGQPSRHRLIQLLSAASISALGVATVALWLEHWSVYPLLLVAGMISGLNWYTSADELSVIRRGGVDDTHRTVARLGVAIGIACALATAGIVYAAFSSGVALNE